MCDLKIQKDAYLNNFFWCEIIFIFILTFEKNLRGFSQNEREEQ